MKVLTSFLKASALYVTPVIFTTVMVKVIDQGGSVFHEVINGLACMVSNAFCIHGPE